MTETTTQPHIGHRIERIRTIKGMKQETLASLLNITQGAVSRIEKSQNVDDEKLQLVADALGVSVDTIKNFDEQAAINIISSNFHDNASVNSNCSLTFNPIEKWLEVIEENKKLYERMLENERKRNEQLEMLLKLMTEKKLPS